MNSTPFVSAVMPTRGRVLWAALALECYLTQDYVNKELVILDDDDEPSFPDGVSMPGVRYFREPRKSVVEKRNRVNDLADGELIAHFDSDDWSQAARLSEQVEFMRQQGKSVVGFNTLLFYEPSTQKVARYIGNTRYACGTSLVYRREFWQAHPFIRPKLTEYGSDNTFVYSARDKQQLACGDAGQMMVARIHEGNTSPNQMYKMDKQLTLADLPAGFPRV